MVASPTGTTLAPGGPLPTIFSRIIAGELPGRFVYRDDRCVAFLSIAPLQPGHTLVVPIEEVDHWIDADPDLAAHLTVVAQKIGRAQQEAFHPTKVALLIAGLEVPHLHLHVVPMRTEADLHFGNADPDPDPGALDAAAVALRAALGPDASA
jgi:histidine triad (HIT) family protein